MKIQLFVDPITKKILGYTKLFEETIPQNKDGIFLEEKEASPLFQITNLERFYFIDGKIIEQEADAYESERNNLWKESVELSNSFKKERNDIFRIYGKWNFFRRNCKNDNGN